MDPTKAKLDLVIDDDDVGALGQVEIFAEANATAQPGVRKLSPFGFDEASRQYVTPKPEPQRPLTQFGSDRVRDEIGSCVLRFGGTRDKTHCE